MSSVEITVRGTSRHAHPAERATVHAAVSLEGPDARRVLADVVAGSGRVAEAVGALHDPDHGPVTRWSAQEVRTWASRPGRPDGERLPLVHHAWAGLQARFSDVGELGRWLGECAGIEGFGVDRVEWDLTGVRRGELVRVARDEAVQDARAKAQAYADALGLGAVRVLAIADAGMLGAGLHPEEDGATPFARASALAGDTAPQLVPEDIEVGARVDARFTVAGE